MALEDRFKIHIPDRELKEAKSVDELFGLVERIVKEKAETAPEGGVPEGGAA